jgi:putative redox protein
MTKEIYVKQLKGSTFAAKAGSNHWVMMDTKAEAGGNDGASTPKELVLMALAGCNSMDVVSILMVNGIERDEHPKIFTEIHVGYVFYGDGIKPEDVERAIELSVTKYCSVSAILSASAKLTHSYKIEPAAKLLA